MALFFFCLPDGRTFRWLTSHIVLPLTSTEKRNQKQKEEEEEEEEEEEGTRRKKQERRRRKKERKRRKKLRSFQINLRVHDKKSVSEKPELSPRTQYSFTTSQVHIHTHTHTEREREKERERERKKERKKKKAANTCPVGSCDAGHDVRAHAKCEPKKQL